MRCISCGLLITDVFHVTDQGNVCDRCWNDPNLFFPEKISTSARLTYIHEIIGKNEVPEFLELPVIKLQQKEIPLFTGKIQARHLLKLYAIFGFEEESLDGYQREMYEDQISEISDYIKNSSAAIMPGIVISSREKLEFTQIGMHDDYGVIKIPIRKGALWIIDGQHRIGGFEKILTDFGNFSDNDAQELNEIFNYEIPVTFIDTYEAVRKINNTYHLDISSVDIERIAFFIINKTQRRLSPSLKDTLLYVISRVGVNGIPAIEKEKWRIEAVAIGIDLNSDIESPFYKKINISGQRGLDRPIQLNTFVSSLRPLFNNTTFFNLDTNIKKDFLFSYWNEIKAINKKAFSNDNYRNYLLLKTLGIYSLNLMAVDFIKSSIINEINYLTNANIKMFIKKFSGFDWSKTDSIISSFGGMKGVKETRQVLLNYIMNK